MPPVTGDLEEFDMKQRLITAAVGLILMVALLYMFQTIALNIFTAVISLVALYELLMATKYVKNKYLLIISFIYAGFYPFLMFFNLQGLRGLALFLYLSLIFLLMLDKHGDLRFEYVAMIAFVTVLIPFSMSCGIRLRDVYLEDGLFFFILAFCGAWITDAGCYFVGTFLGKTKLAPEISPKKTVEGFVGGIIVNVAVTLLLGAGYGLICSLSGAEMIVHYWQFLLFGFLSALLSVLGDLTASLIKRQCSVKDFGTIMPGHGGILDRFDSVLFVMPFTYIFLEYLPLIERF